jgi:hypothetical protein
MSNTQKIKTKDLNLGSIKPHKFNPTTIAVIDKIRQDLADVYNLTLEKWVEGFCRDVHPESEILIWLHISETYQKWVAKLQVDSQAKKEIFEIILSASFCDYGSLASKFKQSNLSQETIKQICDDITGSK